MNALLEHLTCTGQALGISHGIAETEQFNNVAFMDDTTTLAEDKAGAQILLNATQDFEAWSNMRLNLSKTVVVDIDGESGEVDPPQLTYNQQPVKVFQATESCRHLSFWATPNGNMAVTKHCVLAKTKDVLGLLTHHPLETKVAKELFQRMKISVFRFSAAQVRWIQSELDNLQSLWVLKAYKRAEYLANGTTTYDVWYMMMWQSPSPFKNFNEPRTSGCVTRSMSSITRWSSGNRMKCNIIDGPERYQIVTRWEFNRCGM